MGVQRLGGPLIYDSSDPEILRHAALSKEVQS
jgi:hypothetical protein